MAGWLIIATLLSPQATLWPGAGPQERPSPSATAKSEDSFPSRLAFAARTSMMLWDPGLDLAPAGGLELGLRAIWDDAPRGEKTKGGWSTAMEIGARFLESEDEETGADTAVYTLYGGFQVEHVWPSGARLGGFLGAGYTDFHSRASDARSADGTSYILRLPEFGWQWSGLRVSAGTEWEVVRTEFDARRTRTTFGGGLLFSLEVCF